MATATDAWRHQFYSKIQKRDHEQTKSFSDLIEQYQDVLQLYQSSKQQSSLLQKQHKALMEENALLKEENDALKSDGKGAGASLVSSKQVKELEDRIFQLQEELTSAFRGKAEASQTILDLQADMKRVKGELKERDKKLVEADKQQQQLRSEIESQKTELASRDSIIDTLKKELDATRADAASREDKLNKLEKENQRLVASIIQQKQQQAEAMNQIQELYMSLVEQKKLLMTQQNGAAAGTSQTQQNGTKKDQADEDAAAIGGPAAIGNQKSAGASMDMQSAELNAMLAMIQSAPAKKEEKKVVKGRAQIEPPSRQQFKKTLDQQINCVRFSDDGSKIYTGGTDKKISVWAAKTGQLLYTLVGPGESITNVAVSSNSKFVLASSTDSSAWIWDTFGNAPRVWQTLTGHSKKIYAVDFSSDDSKCVTGSHDRTIRIWDTAKGITLKTLIQTCKSSVNDLEVSRDDLIASGHFDAGVRFHDMRTWKLVHEIESAHSQQITSVHFSQDGRLILTASRDSTIKVFDVRGGFQQLAQFQDPEYQVTVNFNKVVFNPSLEYIAAGSSNGNIYIWERDIMKRTHSIRAHQNAISSVAWSPDGSSIASVGLDKSLIVWV